MTAVHPDWRGSEHWSRHLRSCRLCGGLTQLADDSRRPCHKQCAEAEATRTESHAASDWNEEEQTA